MHSSVFFSFLAVAGLASAAPAVHDNRQAAASVQCAGAGSFYTCFNNGFKGYCTSDPCDKKWCPDFEDGTCNKVAAPGGSSSTATNPSGPSSNTAAPAPTCYGAGSYYTCFNNGFKGYCTSDPCDKAWCPDYEAKTCNKKAAPVVPPRTACIGNGTYYQCATNGFRGNCLSDPCAKDWCPDYAPHTCTRVTPGANSNPNPTQPAPTKGTSPPAPPTVIPEPEYECPGTGAYYRCANNGFKGRCSSDPCAKDWCPDFVYKTCDRKTTPPPVVTPSVTAKHTPSASVTPKVVKPSESGYTAPPPSPTPCPESQPPKPKCTGACPPPQPPTESRPTPVECPKAPECPKVECPKLELPGCKGTGNYYQCARNGFKGYCSTDPCSGDWCPDFEIKTCDKPKVADCPCRNHPVA